MPTRGLCAQWASGSSRGGLLRGARLRERPRPQGPSGLLSSPRLGLMPDPQATGTGKKPSGCPVPSSAPRPDTLHVGCVTWDGSRGLSAPLAPSRLHKVVGGKESQVPARPTPAGATRPSKKGAAYLVSTGSLGGVAPMRRRRPPGRAPRPLRPRPGATSSPHGARQRRASFVVAAPGRTASAPPPGPWVGWRPGTGWDVRGPDRTRARWPRGGAGLQRGLRGGRPETPTSRARGRGAGGRPSRTRAFPRPSSGAPRHVQPDHPCPAGCRAPGSVLPETERVPRGPRRRPAGAAPQGCLGPESLPHPRPRRGPSATPAPRPSPGTVSTGFSASRL